jgi:hypothetical protein
MQKIYNIELYDEIHQKLVNKLGLDYVLEKELLDTFLKMTIEDVSVLVTNHKKTFTEHKTEFFIRRLFKKYVILGYLRTTHKFKKMNVKTEKYYNKQYKKKKKIFELIKKS